MKYRITQYETWTRVYEVEADSRVEALHKHFSDESAKVDGSLEFVGDDTEHGDMIDCLLGDELEGEHYPDDLPRDDDRIPGICDIEEVIT